MKYTLEDGSEVDIGWDTEGWDWSEGDYSWLSSEMHTPDGGFFIHGGRVRHQKHVPYGWHEIEDFVVLLRSLAKGLENPQLVWLDDTGGGESGLWVEGTRPPNQADVEALGAVQKRKEAKDRRTFESIAKRHPDWVKGEK